MMPDVRGMRWIMFDSECGICTRGRKGEAPVDISSLTLWNLQAQVISLGLQEMSWREVTCARTGMEAMGVSGF